MAVPPPNLPLSSNAAKSSGAGMQKDAGKLLADSASFPAGTRPGGGHDIPDPFGAPKMQTPPPLPVKPSAPPLAAPASIPPIAPPAFAQPQIKKRSKRWIVLLIGGSIFFIIIVIAGVIVYRVFSTPNQSSQNTTATPIPTPTSTLLSPSPFITESPLPSQPLFNDGTGSTGDTTAQSEIADPDGDSLTNAEEQFYGTNPNQADTDSDGYNDGEEVRAGYDPLGPGKLDSDNDGFPDPDEREFGTDPFNPDTDGDGYNDGTEIQNGYNPLIPSPGDKL